MAPIEPPARPRRARRLRHVHPARKGVVLAWWGFTVTFAALRLLTWLIHIHAAGLGNVTAGGVHIHHYIYGLLLLTATAGCAIIDIDERHFRWLGLAFGVGIALVLDEIALLVELKDVYWTGTYEVTGAIAIVLIGVAGSALVLTRSDRVDD